MAARANGYILHEDTARVIVATGFTRKSENSKTGPMIQVWILVRNESPLDARKNGHTGVICGTCPLQNGTCYVDLGKAPQGIWKAYKRGSYPKLPSVEVFKRRVVRFGAYGDPVYIPFSLLRAIAEASAGFTGYTHQWRNPLFAGY